MVDSNLNHGFTFVRDVEVFAGDILGVRGLSVISRGILWASRRKGERETQISHVGLITQGGTLEAAIVTEAARGRVIERTVGEAYCSGQGLVVLRPRTLSEFERQLLVRDIRARLGERYGYGDISLHLLERLTGWEWARRLVSDRRPICSVLVAGAFERQGYSFGLAAHTAQPDDIYDYAVQHPRRYSLPLGPVPLALDEPVV